MVTISEVTHMCVSVSVSVCDLGTPTNNLPSYQFVCSNTKNCILNSTYLHWN
jgi:hypothetical protein